MYFNSKQFFVQYSQCLGVSVAVIKYNIDFAWRMRGYFKRFFLKSARIFSDYSRQNPHIAAEKSSRCYAADGVFRPFLLPLVTASIRFVPRRRTPGVFLPSLEERRSRYSALSS